MDRIFQDVISRPGKLETKDLSKDNQPFQETMGITLGFRATGVADFTKDFSVIGFGLVYSQILNSAQTDRQQSWAAVGGFCRKKNEYVQ